MFYNIFDFPFGVVFKQHILKFSLALSVNHEFSIIRSRKLLTSISNMYSCPKCSYSVQTKICFDEHYARVHEGTIIARCPICEKAFKSKSNIWHHIQAVHETQSFPCSECDYIGKTKQSLSRHTGLHHKDKIFACEFCDFRAGYQFTVNRHTLFIVIRSWIALT